MSFRAKYSGRCAACTEVIEAGDQLEWEDGQAVHADCHKYGEPAVPKATCSECWQEIAHNGACGCDPE